MKRTELEEMLLYKALAFKQTRTGVNLIDYIENGNLTVTEGSLELKNVCAKVSPALAEELDKTCHLLGISKRRFVEAAIIEALNKADEIIADVDMFDEAGEGMVQP